MGYPDGEAAILTRLQAVSGFDADNTSRGDWRILNSGASRQYGILRMGPWVNPTQAMTTIRPEYRTVIELFYRLKDDSTTATGLQGVIEDVTASLVTYRKMGDSTNVLRARVSGGGEMQETVVGNTTFFKSEVYIDWQAQNAITYAE